MDVAFWASIAVLAAALFAFAVVVPGVRRMAHLRDIAPHAPCDPPRVSIVIAALNEAHTIEPALRSVLALDYPDLEVVAVDDRSTDETGEILDRLGREFPSLRVEHVRELPAGWLGKNHALHRGAALADGRYVLFSDADVVFEPTSVARAVAHCERHQLDHLAILPQVPRRSRLTELILLEGLVGLIALFRPWRARSGRGFMGVGAFNLVRAASWQGAGGHEAIAMEVLDDILLAERMHLKGFRQDVLLGADMISVEIYRTLGEAIRGVEKNTFAFLDYSVANVLASTAGIFALWFWPWIGLATGAGGARWVNAASIAMLFVVHAACVGRLGVNPRALAWFPLGGVIPLYFIWRAMILTWLRGGIVWRGTFYPLAELRARHRRTAHLRELKVR